MLKNRIILNRRGVTLIELIIALGILGIVLAVAFSLFSFNLRTFGSGEVRSEVQFDVRMAAEHITYQVRNAREISTSEISPGEFIDLDELQIRFSRVVSVEFEIVEEDAGYFLEYDITGFHDQFNTEYELNSRVLLNNILSADEGSGGIIYFTKGN